MKFITLVFVVLTILNFCCRSKSNQQSGNSTKQYSDSANEGDLHMKDSIVKYFPNGKIESRGILSNGMKNGLAQLFYESGNVKQ